jgi:hypothetical protein
VRYLSRQAGCSKRMVFGLQQEGIATDNQRQSSS